MIISRKYHMCNVCWEIEQVCSKELFSTLWLSDFVCVDRSLSICSAIGKIRQMVVINACLQRKEEWVLLFLLRLEKVVCFSDIHNLWLTFFYHLIWCFSISSPFEQMHIVLFNWSLLSKQHLLTHYVV